MLAITGRLRLLDANSCIGYLNGRSVGVARRLQMHLPSEVVVCSVVKAELFYGAEKSMRPDENRSKQKAFFDQFISLPFDDRCAEYYGRIRAHLTSAGTPIGPNDLLIASIALANDCILVTHNTREFGRVPGLDLEDWEI